MAPLRIQADRVASVSQSPVAATCFLAHRLARAQQSPKTAGFARLDASFSGSIAPSTQYPRRVTLGDSVAQLAATSLVFPKHLNDSVIFAQQSVTRSITEAVEVARLNIAENHGLAISITGILIVFAALILITLFIMALPRVLAVLETVLPSKPEHHAGPASATSSTNHDEAVVAAIGFALHARHRKKK